ncbi:hypothetical protein [uncultured Desulfosarcina sp.]|uniref:hypothetical protein n=1 Tax=uncultured Desulfosarcina sp. TaxID=218289 RepID=UPI0029C73DAC|nr:hypothetical protein [uncultured Desulfosarcina sp.]
MSEKTDKKRVRTEKTFLRAARDFCSADADVQLSKRQWSELHQVHDLRDGVCCLEWRDDEPVIPRSEWCEACLKYEKERVDYHYALLRRRSAKARMKRAYKILYPQLSP